MKIVINPPRSEWPQLLIRPHKDFSMLQETVASVLKRIEEEGDSAVRHFEELFDHVRLDSLQVTEAEIEQAAKSISPELKDAIDLAHHNIHTFHSAQHFESRKTETCPGVVCWQRAVPIQKVGLYIPGGTAPLFSTVLMLATPAKIAQCPEIVLCSPPNKEGKLHPAILYAAQVAGVGKIFKIGGVQAIAAMAYGTESVPHVDKIFGPGNQYVMAAKQQVALHNVAIDMPAGPSEVAVLADSQANPSFVAADLLSQAEHGIDSQVMLITDCEQMINAVKEEVEKQLQALPRKEIAATALENSTFILTKSLQEAMDIVNCYAPEHLIIASTNYEELADQVINAGSVFLGQYSCESAGDYASGTNHTLPTAGYARAYSGVSLDSFMRKITFQELSEEGIRQIGRAVEIMAENEGLAAHKNAMTLRIKTVTSDKR